MPGQPRFDLSLSHRAILGRRSETGKVALPRHCDLLSPWVLSTVAELVTVGVVEFLGRKVMEHPLYGVISLDVYGLTPHGRDLCATHDIWKAEENQTD